MSRKKHQKESLEDDHSKSKKISVVEEREQKLKEVLDSSNTKHGVMQ